MTTRINTDGIADDAVTTAKIAAAAVGTSELADGGVTAAKIASGAVPVFIGARQTVQGGPINASGLPDFLPASSVTLTLATQNISATYPLSVSASQGHGSGAERIGSVTGNTLSWTLSASSGVNYLYVDIAANGTLTTGQTTTAPVYSYSGSAATASGTNTFNITLMKMYAGNGTTAPAVWRVFVGEATAGASSISAAIAYAYNGVFSGYASAITPLVTTAMSVNHNLGITPKSFGFFTECITTDGSFSVGHVTQPIVWNGSYMLATPVAVTSKKCEARCASSWCVSDIVTGGAPSLAAAKWKGWFECERGW